jgi:hypothetical protein
MLAAPHAPRAADGAAPRRSKLAAVGESGAAKVRAPSGAPGSLISEPFNDYFNRSDIGQDYVSTSDAWKIQGGKLCGRGARNHPLWLTRRLPKNARIEFDAMSRSTDGDIKVEAWGDGKSAATGTSYNNATSYIFIYGGWRNTYHVLAKHDEHAKDRLELKVNASEKEYRARPVDPNRLYHFKIERSDGVLRWSVDDIEIHSLNDSKPLEGPGHEHFGFNNWEVAVCFDNLTITPLRS